MGSFFFFRGVLVVSLLVLLKGVTSSLDKEFSVSWASDHVRFFNGGQELQLTLDQNSGSGFASKNKYLFGNINMQIKLVPGDSAGTVTAYYLSSEGANHDYLDFEFLGNKTGEPYVVQTNVYASGKGDREQRIYLWFDPTTDFHSYGVVWTAQHILGCQTCGEGDPRTGVCRFPGRPKNGSLQVSRKAKDGSLKPFHVHAHTEFAFVLNSADL